MSNLDLGVDALVTTRLERGLSQQAIAKKMKIAAARVSAFERGREVVTEDFLRRYQKATKIDWRELQLVYWTVVEAYAAGRLALAQELKSRLLSADKSS